MMDMKAPVSLANSHAPKAESPLRVDSSSQSESEDFDRHLTKQMDQAEAGKKPDKINKDQSYSKDSELQQTAEIESESKVIDGQTAVNEWLLEKASTVDGNIPLDSVIEVENEHLLVEQIDEQLMPLAGKTLPQGIKPENLLNNGQINQVQTNQDQSIKFDAAANSALTSRNSNKQPALAEVLVESAEEKSPTTEFKPEIKTQQTNNNQPARPGLNIAGLVATASVQQHVPQATASTAINMQSATATEGFASSSSLTGSIGPAVQSPNWSQGLTEKVSWMMQGNMQTAELKLNPAHLGPLEVKLVIQDDKASITFVTGHAQVKEAIDSAMPRLREMLEQQGLDLTDVDVSQYSDAKDEQADSSEQNENISNRSEPDQDQSTSAAMHESLINIDVNSGVSIFV